MVVCNAAAAVVGRVLLVKFLSRLNNWYQARQRRKRNERSRSILPMTDEDQRFWLKHGVTSVSRRGKTWRSKHG